MHTEMSIHYNMISSSKNSRVIEKEYEEVKQSTLIKLPDMELARWVSTTYSSRRPNSL